VRLRHEAFVGQAHRLPRQPERLLYKHKAEHKLSELMAIGFNSSKAFEGGNWRKN